MGFSALVVPVPAADWLMADRVADDDSPAAGLRVPAHITLLAPFAPRPELGGGVLDELEVLFSAVVPFTFALDEVSEFPDGPVYLAPDPSTPFRQLTLEVSRAFPEYPPYEGRFDDVVPHVTVPLRDGETVADIERLVAVRRPLAGYAQEVQLLWVPEVSEVDVGTGIEVVAEFPFGTAAA